MVQTITVVTQMVDKLSGKTRRMQKQIQSFGGGVERTTERVQEFNNGVQKTDRTIRSTTTGIQRFQMHLLSVMFFGMLLQRVFLGLARSATQAMMKMTEGQTEAGQAITRLSAAWQFLKFEIGEAIGTALLPLMDTIVGIVDGVADWIEKNPQLTAGILGLGAAAGTALFAIGTLGLGLQGLNTLIGIGPGGGGLVGGLMALPGPVKAVGIAAAVAAGLILTNWDALGPGITKTVGVIKDAFTNMETDLDDLTKNWDEAMDLMLEGSVVVMVRIVKAFVKGFETILNLQNAFQRYLMVRMATFMGATPTEAREAARAAVPSAQTPSFITGALNNLESDLLADIRSKDNRGININGMSINVFADGTTNRPEDMAALGFRRGVLEEASKYGPTTGVI